MYLVKGDPIKERRDRINGNMTPEQKKAYELLYANDDLGFIIQKRTRREKNVGDVFVCSVKEGVFYYGRVLKIVDHKHSACQFYDDTILVCLYKDRTSKKTMENFIGGIERLMFAPKLISRAFWSNGYFETIGNVPLTAEEKKLDYGFWQEKGMSNSGYFIKEDGSVMDHEPKFFNMMAVTTYWGFYRTICEQIILEPDLADV